MNQKNPSTRGGSQGIFGHTLLAAPPPFKSFKIRAIQSVVSVVDVSPSMGAEHKTEEANRAFAEFNQLLCDPQNRDGFLHGVVAFNEGAWVVSNFASPTTLAALNPIQPSGYGTNIGQGLAKVRELLDGFVAPPDSELLASVLFLLSDGCTEDIAQAEREAEALKQRGCIIVTCAFGGDADDILLRRLATSHQHHGKCMTGPQLLAFLAKVGHTLRVTQRAGTNACAALASVASAV